MTFKQYTSKYHLPHDPDQRRFCSTFKSSRISVTIILLLFLCLSNNDWNGFIKETSQIWNQKDTHKNNSPDRCNKSRFSFAKNRIIEKLERIRKQKRQCIIIMMMRMMMFGKYLHASDGNGGRCYLLLRMRLIGFFLGRRELFRQAEHLESFSPDGQCKPFQRLIIIDSQVEQLRQEHSNNTLTQELDFCSFLRIYFTSIISILFYLLLINRCKQPSAAY